MRERQENVTEDEHVARQSGRPEIGRHNCRETARQDVQTARDYCIWIFKKTGRQLGPRGT
jgi:hypothetical protein